MFQKYIFATQDSVRTPKVEINGILNKFLNIRDKSAIQVAINEHHHKIQKCPWVFKVHVNPWNPDDEIVELYGIFHQKLKPHKGYQKNKFHKGSLPEMQSLNV